MLLRLKSARRSHVKRNSLNPPSIHRLWVDRPLCAICFSEEQKVETSVEFINLQDRKNSPRSTGVTERGSSVDKAAMMKYTETVQV